MILSPRWTKLDPHPEQYRLWNSTARIKVVPAGRRSGKTELAKRNLVLKAISFCGASNGRFIVSAPTQPQAKSIYWDDLKALVPTKFLRTPDKPFNSIKEAASQILLWNGAKIEVIGMDKPERAEGTPIDGIVLDEYGDMKPQVWTSHIRPALSTKGRLGWAWLIGVPEGRNHYYHMFKDAKRREKEGNPEWGAFTWASSTVLSPEEIAAAMEELDPKTFDQEYNGAFISFSGMAYYQFNANANVLTGGNMIPYDDKKLLMLCFDFNHIPGVAVIVQEITVNGMDIPVAIDEVFLAGSSNTYLVCEKILEKYKNHKTPVLLYGDPAGGHKTSQSVNGSDWELVHEKLDEHLVAVDKFPKSHLPVRTRLNMTNARFCNAAGKVKSFVNGNCKRLIDDFEGVEVDDSGQNIIDKKGPLSHISDAWGYLISQRYKDSNSETVWSNSLTGN